MNQLVVIAFDHFDDARAALRSLRGLEAGGRIRFEDTALIERDPDGTTETAAVVGALIGGFVGFVFPVAGAVIGAAAGAAVGSALRTGVEPAFVDEVKETLRPGRSALFLVIKDSDLDASLGALRQFRGDVVQSTLSSEAEEALRSALAVARR
jgi:uncharacterized membrane protein